MDETRIKETHWTKLRRRAEARVRNAVAEHIRSIDPDDLDFVLHELQVTQTELEMQNEELISNREILETAEQKLAALYRKYANLFDFAPNGYLVLDSGGAIREGNMTAAIGLGTPKAKLVGKRITDFIHSDDQDLFYLYNRDCRENDLSPIFEIEMVRKDKTTFTAQAQLQCFLKEETDCREIRMAFMDISGDTSVFSSLTLLQNCLETAGNANTRQMLLTGFVQHIKVFTGASAVGIRLQELDKSTPSAYCEGFGKNFFRAEHLFDLCNGPCVCAATLNRPATTSPSLWTEQGSFFINAALRPSIRNVLDELGGFCPGCCLNGYDSAALIPVLDKGAVLGLIYVADRRENKVPLRVVRILEKAALRLSMAVQRIDAQDRLGRSVAELEDLSLRLLSAQEEEQRRIAGELHDQTGQELCLFKLRLKEILDRVSRHDPNLRADGNQLMALTDRIIDNTRQIIHGLNPVPLEHAGLLPALEQLAAEFTEASPLQVRLNLKHLDCIKARDVQLGIYRILQETLTNIVKHAGARRAVISSARRGSTLFIKIEDDGKGFDHGILEAWDSRNIGLGLRSMALRVRLIGGELKLSNRKGKGTRITLRLQLAE